MISSNVQAEIERKLRIIIDNCNDSVLKEICKLLDLLRREVELQEIGTIKITEDDRLYEYFYLSRSFKVFDKVMISYDINKDITFITSEEFREYLKSDSFEELYEKMLLVFLK